MTWFSHLMAALLVGCFGNVVVKPRNHTRVLRIFKAILEENDFNPKYIPEIAYENLVSEIYHRASLCDARGILRWKHVVSEMISTGETVCSALRGIDIQDERIHAILILHNVKS